MRRRITKKVAEAAKAKEKAYQIHDITVQGLILRVQPTGNKIWKLIQDRKPRTLGKMPVMTHAMAEAKALSILRGEIQPEDEQPEEITESAPLTFREYLANYYQPYVETHHTRPKETKSIIKAFDLHDTLLTDIKLADVEKWRNKQKTSKGTINRKTATLQAALQRAVDWDMLESNPLAKLKPLKVDKRAVMRYLDTEEAAGLEKALVKAKPWLKSLVTVALNTGLRRGELWNLAWADVDLKRNMLTVHGKGAKSGQTRHVPLNTIAVQAFKDFKKKTFKDTTPLPSLPIFGRHEFKKAFATLLKNAEIEEFRFHDCRHTFASNLVMAGVPLNTVRELMGHASMEMTLVYAHLAPASLQAAVDMLVPMVENNNDAG